MASGSATRDLAARMRGGVRSAFQLRDLVLDERGVFEQMMRVAPQHAGPDVSALMHEMRQAWKVVQRFVTDNLLALLERAEGGARVLFEGAQSVMLDVAHGAQPWVTSSHTLPSYAYVGGDLPCKYHRKTIGAAKAIVSRVGERALANGAWRTAIRSLLRRRGAGGTRQGRRGAPVRSIGLAGRRRCVLHGCGHADALE